MNQLVILLFFISHINSFTASPDCELLREGRYKVTHTINSTEPGSELQIDQGNFRQRWTNGDSVAGRLTWTFKCQLFKLENTNPIRKDTGKLDNWLARSFGDPIYEIQSVAGNTIFFRRTFAANLHITTSKGMIIKAR